MLKHVLVFTQKLYQRNPVVVCISAAIIILATDYISGKPVEFQIAYVIPVGMAAWQEEKITAYLLAILLPFVRVGFHFLWKNPAPLYFAVLNATINTLALILYTYLISHLKMLVRKIKILQGFLPICCYCKKIRASDGSYVQMEQYITEHSGARFSHGICPECLNEFHPDCCKDGKELNP